MKTIATLFLLLAASAIATGQSGEGEKGKIIALENSWNMAEQQKDVKALSELVGSNLVYIDYDGAIQNKEQFLASVGSPSLHPEQIVNESTTVYMYGSTAVVTGTYREKASKRVSRICGGAALPTPGSMRTGRGSAWPANRR